MNDLQKRIGVGGLLLSLAAIVPALATAQGVLTITPGRSVTTLAGTGTPGYAGDNGAATTATLAAPAAVAYDAAGNLFIADSNNHVVREVLKNSSTIVTVAGTGVAGFSGDGGAASAAQLDTPTGIAVDASGNLYIADSHNERIRKVNGGIITTVAGTGVTGFSGDGAAATAAQLALPHSVAVDLSGNLYIADTNNQRIRKITGTTITTIAGTGEQSYSGDGAAAIAAALDSPTSVAVDTGGLVYIADRHNQRIRVIGANGTISTLAGSGTPTFAGGFSGDGGSANVASLSRPTGVSVDGAGNVYIADSNNQRVRTVTASAITTALGNGNQGFAGDGGSLASATLDTPKMAAVDSLGNLSLADDHNNRIRGALDAAALAFSESPVGTSSTTQTITLSNTGSGSLTIASLTLTGPFAATAATTCSAVPFTLSAGASCTEVLAFVPSQAGVATGSIAFAGPGAAPETVLLSAVGGVAGTKTTVLASLNPAVETLPVTFTANVTAVSGPVPNGSVSFSEGRKVLATLPLTNGSAAYVTTALTPGSHVLTAAYLGSGNDAASSGSVTELIASGATFTLTDSGASSFSTAVQQGLAAETTVTITPGPTFSGSVNLSCAGLPEDVNCIFTPSSLSFSAGGKLQTSTVLIRSSKLTYLSSTPTEHLERRLASMFWLPAALLVGMSARGRKIRSLQTLALVFLSSAMLYTLTGCGSGAKPLYATAQSSPGTYTFNIVATSNGNTQSLPVTLTVQSSPSR